MNQVQFQRQAIAAYFDCFRTQDLERLRQLLTPDFRHVSPFGEWTDRERMLATIWPSVTGDVYATDLQIYGDGPEYLVRYRHAGKSSARIVEYFRFEGDQIAEIEVYPGRDAAS